jgi:hypothetical protein
VHIITISMRCNDLLSTTGTYNRKHITVHANELCSYKSLEEKLTLNVSIRTQTGIEPLLNIARKIKRYVNISPLLQCHNSM